MIKSLFCLACLMIAVSLSALPALAVPVIYINQVAFDLEGPKLAVVGDKAALPSAIFYIINKDNKVMYTGRLPKPQKLAQWDAQQLFYPIDFSDFKQTGSFRIKVIANNVAYMSAAFEIGEQQLEKLTLPAILQYYHHQRANTPQELEVDRHLLLYGSDKRVDLRGGWADASGDISKYFSHLAYANFMSPQQIPLVAWSMAGILQNNERFLQQSRIQKAWADEMLWGADYLVRALSDEGYFYMTVFSYFKKDPNTRRVVGLRANSVTTSEYQCAFREGGGMGIASLARISTCRQHGDYSAAQYLQAAERAYAHLILHNKEYDDDGKENIIDDYAALMAASELWIATDNAYYGEQARMRAQHLVDRISPNGYFIADDGTRPFWHAADAGLPVIALARFLDKEQDAAWRSKVLETIKKALDYNLTVTHNTVNPFGYARQSFSFKGKIMDGFFIPHDNESGWWWQGENARILSLATAAIVGGRLVYPSSNPWGVKKELADYASQQISWVLGGNPYRVCFMYGFGQKNVPYMHALFGHGSQKGGISNGITGKKGNGDGSGIDFRMEDAGNEWRWTEQWIPHAAYFMQAMSAIAMAQKN